MTILIKDVREYLSDISIDRVGDGVIQRWISIATTQVSNEKSEIALAADVDNAILAIAGHRVYLAYANKYERSAGLLPAPVLYNLQLYEAYANYLLGIVARGTVGTGVPAARIDSVITEVRDGNYET